ncbi:hypothetical protein JMK10_05270 [Rhodovulum sulfidophilum]|uniref:hypothetical protein n=1 Tax=Rhodovulum sulfidophilum TaxID=35806 RepID=UPI0019245EBC|nr:hypothetical protein [Rhodovulum sulfidophilum]MBL3574637.1 hypothetical protein [Rhodovulum sulfidophilum]MCE8431545.1 hypothetical protein [Rhodovulum sulfidophilum]MCF4116229.1 hypothetical protein [Rhodovulum sulfidophilum]
MHGPSARLPLVRLMAVISVFLLCLMIGFSSLQFKQEKYIRGLPDEMETAREVFPELPPLSTDQSTVLQEDAASSIIEEPAAVAVPRAQDLMTEYSFSEAGEGMTPTSQKPQANTSQGESDIATVIVGGAIHCAATSCLRGRNSSRPRAAASAARPQNCLRYGVVGHCRDVDLILANLGTADIAYNKPDSMIRGKPGIISFVVDLSPQEVPSDAFDGLPGQIVRADVPVSRYISAELWGAEDVFKISPAGPVRKQIFASSENRWDWTVKPLLGGAQVLKLKTYVHLTENGAPRGAIGWKTFEATIPVKVTTSDRIRDMAAEIQPIHAIVLFVMSLAGGAWANLRRRKKTEPQEALTNGQAGKPFRPDAGEEA